MNNISVIIPAYNAEDTIIRALNSVINQTIKPFEIIIIDDGSKDKTYEVVENYSKIYSQFDFRLIKQRNGGVSSARNAGLLIAKGDFIALLDSDDEWLPNKSELQINILNKNPQIDFLGCNLVNSSISILGRKRTQLCKVKLWELLVKMHPQTSTAIFKTEIIQDVGIYDTKLRYAEDGNYWLRICLKKEFYFSPNELVVYDGGRMAFSGNGLASNLVEMQKGNIYNLKQIYSQKYINLPTYIIFLIYYNIKYLRRRLIVKMRKWKEFKGFIGG